MNKLATNFQKKNQTKNSLAILFTTIFLASLGLVMMYSAGKYQGETIYSDKFFFLKKQLVGVIVGGVGMWFFSISKPRLLEKYATPIAILSAILLALVYVDGIGVENYGAKRWLKVFFFTIQPSDLAKFALVVFSAKSLSKSVDITLATRVPVYIASGIYMLLIFFEPNLSITICVALLTLAMLIVGGLKPKYLAIFALAGIALLPVLIVAEPYRLKRLFAFVDPFASPKAEGFQLIQSLYALASGGLFGVGLFNSRQALRFLPFGESDFVFSIYVEETGFFGGIFLMAVFLIYIYTGIKIAISAKTRFEMYLAFGVSMLVCLQTLINIAVVIGAIPPTGLPLPFISSGNTQVITFMAMSGVLIGIAKNAEN